MKRVVIEVSDNLERGIPLDQVLEEIIDEIKEYLLRTNASYSEQMDIANIIYKHIGKE